MAAPSPPDYSQYIAEMSRIGARGQDNSTNLYNWARDTGADLQGRANKAGDRATTLSEATMGTDPRLEARWEQTYLPLYDAQARDATRMIDELPNTEEQYAGKFAADTGQALDAAKATQQRTLQGYGLKRPGVASTALDMTAANQRAAATTAASETGRLAARNEARGATTTALTAGKDIPTVGGQQATIGMQAGQQSVALPSTAISTTAGAYSPSLGYYQASYPFMAQWGQTMSNAYNQNLAAYNAGEASGGGAGALAGAGIGALGQIGGAYAGSEGGSKTISGFFSSKGGMIPHLGHGGTLGTILGTVGRIGGKVIGSIYGGPIGGMIGGKLGGMAGDTLGDVASGNSQYIGEDVGQDAMPTGGDAMSLWAADGGDVTQPSNNYVDPNMSPSKGAITDDVPARLQAGEFVFPEDVVAWRGEQWMHKEIMKARQEREKTTAQSGAEPEMGPAIDTQQPPNFVSEGARV